MSGLDHDLVRRLPKVELHVHLEGTIEPEEIAALAAEVGEPLPRPVDQLFSADGLSDFLSFLDWTCGLVRSPETAARVARAYAARATRDGVRYAEVIVNPTHWPNLPIGELVAGVTAGFEQAEAAGLADCRLLLSILRAQPAEEAEALATWMATHRPARVVGLSVDGNEQRSGRTGERFRRAYAIAREAGLGLTAHAGESSGPDGVRDALDLLGVHRLDHGVRAVEDPALVERLAGGTVALNVCLTSNAHLLYPGLAQHPFPDLVAAGVPVTINTDDPAFLGCDLTGEFLLAAGLVGWRVEDLAQVTRTAVAASFAPDARRRSLLAELDVFLGEIADPPEPERTFP